MIDANMWESLRHFNSMDISGCAMGYAVVDDPQEWYWEQFTYPFNKLYFMQEGSISIDLLDSNSQPETSYRLTPGNVYLIPCGNEYTLSTPSGFRKTYMHINLPMTDGYDLLYGVREIIGLPYDMSVLQKKRLEASEAPYPFALYVKAIAFSIVSQLLTQTHSPDMQQRLYAVSHYPPDLLAAIHNIRSAADARLTVAEIAHQTGVSSSTLAQMFKDHLHITPKKYMNDRLYESARLLLLSTNQSIKEISCNLHFSTPFAFSNFFKLHSGMAPLHYRQIYQNL